MLRESVAGSWISGVVGWASDLRLGTTVNVLPLRLCTAGLGGVGVGSITMSSMLVTGSLSAGDSSLDGTDLT